MRKGHGTDGTYATYGTYGSRRASCGKRLTANWQLPTANRQPPTLLRDGSHGFAAAFVGFFGWMTGWYRDSFVGGEIG